MKRKMKKTLAFLTALVLTVSLLGNDRLFVAAETMAENVAETVVEQESGGQAGVHDDYAEEPQVSEGEADNGSAGEAVLSDVGEPADSDPVYAEKAAGASGQPADPADGKQTVQPADPAGGELTSQPAATQQGTDTAAQGQAEDEEPTAEAAQPESEEPTTQVAEEEDEKRTTQTSEAEFSLNTALDGVMVNIHAKNGILPEGATAKVSQLADGVLDTAARSIRERSAERNLVQLIGFEISFFDANGEELHQFEDKVEITYSELTFAENAGEMQVFHADANGNVTEALTESMALSSEVSFSSDHFSPFLVAVYGSAADADSGILGADGEGKQSGGINLMAIGGEDSISIEVGQTYEITSSTTGSNPADDSHSESWSSDNTAVATIEGITNDDNGYKQTKATITGVSEGTATITHTYYVTRSFLGYNWLESQTEALTVTVVEPVINYYNVSFHVGEDAEVAGVTVPDPVTVAGGETVQNLPAPEWKNEDDVVMVFAGWYTDENLTTEFTSSTPVTGDMTLYAAWVEPDAPGMYYVNFYSQDGQTVYLTVSAAKGKTVNPAAGPAMEGKVFRGWSVTMQGDSPASDLAAFDFGIPVGEAAEEGSNTLNLYAWYAPMVKVSFVSNGGMSVPTQVIAQGDTAESVTPTRTGYTFRGWSTDPDTYTAFDFSTPVTDDIMLYAFWTANMVPVTLVYMYENADDEDYSPAGHSETVYAPAGSYLSIEKRNITQTGQNHSVRYSETADGDLTGYASTAAAGGRNATIADVRDTYFQYNSATNKRQVMPDGSTVMLVYYNRARVTLMFTYNLNSDASIDVNGHISAENQQKYNVVYTPTTSGNHNRFTYSFTAKYGQNIVPVWPQIGWVSNDSSSGNRFYTWRCPDNHDQTSNMYTLESSLFTTVKIEDGVLVGEGTIYSRGSDVSKDWLIYARTTLPGETIDFVYDNKNYTIYTEACQLGYSPSGIFGYKALDGCEAATSATLQTKYPNSGNGNMQINGLSVQNGTLKSKFDTAFPYQIESNDPCQVLLYDRDGLTLTAYTNDTTYTTAQTAYYLYGDWIYNDEADLLKTLESNMSKDGYRFAGWYTDPNFTPGTEYTTDKDSRITANLNLYAKWEPNQFLAEYYLYMDDVTPYATQGFAEGGRIDDKFVPTAVQDSFLGWYWYQNGTLVPFDFTASVGQAHVDSSGVLKLYAMWEGDTGNVSYLPGAGGDNSTQGVVDPRDFEINQAAVQLQNYTNVWTDGSVPADKSLTFVGWKAPNGTIYQPGRYVLVTRQLMQFEAQWSKDAVQLIYDANSGEGAQVIENWARNSVVSIWDNMDATTPHFTRDGYELLGWDTNANATTPTYLLGEGSITLTQDSTTLYAIWKRSTVDLTITKTVSGSFGDRTKDFEFEVYVKDKDGKAIVLTPPENAGYSVDTNGKVTFSLKHEDSIVLSGVPVNALINVKEMNASGYTVSFNGVQSATNEGIAAVEYGVETLANKTIAVLNHKEGVPDTGVLLDSLPYILILAVVVFGAAFLVFFRRKNKLDA